MMSHALSVGITSASRRARSAGAAVTEKASTTARVKLSTTTTTNRMTQQSATVSTSRVRIASRKQPSSVTTASVSTLPSSFLHPQQKFAYSSSSFPFLLNYHSTSSSSSSIRAFSAQPLNNNGDNGDASKDKAQPSSSSSPSVSSAAVSANKPPSPAVLMSKQDEHQEETKRLRLSDVKISEVLKAKHAYRWVDPVISRHATVRQAITTAIEGGLSGMMVLNNGNDHNHVVGLLTSRDLLRIMASGIKDGETDQLIFNRVIGDFMTPISQVIYARPDETVGMCRTIMAKLGIKTLPILSRQGRVEGLITARDMSDYGLSASERGGKKSYLTDVSTRVGLSSNTSMAEPPAYMRGHLGLERSPLYINIGTAMLPHPFKTETGVGSRSLKDMNQLEYASNPYLSEDAYFYTTVYFPDTNSVTENIAPAVKSPVVVVGGSSSAADSSAKTTTTTTTDTNEKQQQQQQQRKVDIRKFIYMGVADGVGSWREYGVDPREFSHRLMEECQNVLEEASYEPPAERSSSNDDDDEYAKNNTSTTNPRTTITPTFTKKDGPSFRQIVSPAEVMAQAYERLKADDIIGSCTACIALFDGVRHQLHFSNLGDSGLIVLRHIDSDVAGTLKRNRVEPRTERKSDLQISFVSQQQLRSFNHPFQLGWTGEELPEEERETTSFKTARDACTSSIHVRRGDIIIMATDGLFDNVDVEDIKDIALEWEQRHGFIRGGDIGAREHRWKMGNSLTVVSSEQIAGLAKTLCLKARENSVNHELDSPFAILAKENDIMWSGGMPDDCTVLAVHVVGRDATDVMDQGNK